jgi:glutamate synthase domain-containing protein 1
MIGRDFSPREGEVWEEVRESSVCGIVGLVGRPQGVARDPIGAALKAMASRGPDGSGRVEGRLGPWPVYLGATRLDLVEAAESQPVKTARGAYLVFNGEIYNHRELRRDLEGRGEIIRDGGDAALLAGLLECDGVGGYPAGWRNTKIYKEHRDELLSQDGIVGLLTDQEWEDLETIQTVDHLIAIDQTKKNI